MVFVHTVYECRSLFYYSRFALILFWVLLEPSHVSPSGRPVFIGLQLTGIYFVLPQRNYKNIYRLCLHYSKKTKPMKGNPIT